jgi:hypothetical protein
LFRSAFVAVKLDGDLVLDPWFATENLRDGAQFQYLSGQGRIRFFLAGNRRPRQRENAGLEVSGFTNFEFAPPFGVSVRTLVYSVTREIDPSALSNKIILDDNAIRDNDRFVADVENLCSG